MRFGWLSVLGLVGVGVVACSATEDVAVDQGALNAIGANDLPWEVRTREGELVLPNVFYADASETDQLMSTKVHGRQQIDRLVYPTIGNPNLYVRPDANDAGLVVLRIEEALLAHLGTHWDGSVEGSPLTAVTFDHDDDRDGIRFFLVARSARDQAETEGAAAAKPGVFPVKPSAMLAHPTLPGMPPALAARRTLRAEFDKTALADVPGGLYDVRFEVRRGGAVVASEFQYNAVRVFDRAADEYSIVNVTDTQVTAGTKMEELTLAKMKEFVQRVNRTTDSDVRDAAFITFNGDLHNGGSPEVLLPESVANTYRTEAEAIIDQLKELEIPIFLTAGNHDGYVSTGHPLPGIDKIATLLFKKDLKATVRASRPELSAGDFDRMWASFEAYRDATNDQPGGRHVDLYGGKFTHGAVDRSHPWASWKAVDTAKANVVLYDGFNQWRRTYGPLYTSWDFGKTRYVNMNTYELRQHRRSGWGMYTVNYGGGMSLEQEHWVKGEVDRAEQLGKDVVLVAHHDPRGGHNGHDYPYQFDLIEYQPGVSTYNYVLGEVYNKYACTGTLDWVRAALAKLGLAERQLSCLHDGLQEWMRPDEFDCEEQVPRDGEGKCILDPATANDGHNHLWSSGFALIDEVATHPSVRTMLLGHTHYNSLEVLQSGDEIVPRRIELNEERTQQLQGLEFATTLRSGASRASANDVVNQANALSEQTSEGSQRNLGGQARELVILRTTSAANLTSQKHETKPMYGFATLRVSANGQPVPRINSVTFFINDGGTFEAVKKLPLDRTKHVASSDADNPVNAFFQLDK